MYSGTLKDKMKLLFSSFDTDNNGGLDKEEFATFAKIVSHGKKEKVFST